MEGAREFSMVVADDYGIVREGIVAYLRSRMNVRILAQCSNGDEALREIREHRPDFAILDANLPKQSALSVIQSLRQSGCTTRLIVFCAGNDDATMAELFRSGADACLLKDSPATELLEAAECTLAGGQYICRALRRDENAKAGTAPDPAVLLSRREYQVFLRLIEGIRPRDIAKDLDISPKTVDTYRANILRKLELEGIAGLIRFALQIKQPSRSLPANGP